jgi:cytochrome c oxidase cbb3-type subunit 3
VALDEHKRERDPLSGHMMTGHEWNGIKELNTPVPRVVWFFLTLAALFGLGYWVLMPAWPIGTTYTKGLLNTNQHKIVNAKVQRAAADRSHWTGQIAAKDIDAIRADPALMAFVREDGHRLFGDNCAACHGIEATGNPGFPNLTDGDWLWGGSADAIAHTIAVGVNSAASPQTRISQMLAFGKDGILDSASVQAVADYVKSLSDPAWAKANAASVAAGQEIFAANCAVCHGDQGRGNQQLGAPDLADNVWLHGGEIYTIYTTIHDGRQGEMPAWGNRLSPVDQKILTAFLLDKGSRR